MCISCMSFLPSALPISAAEALIYAPRRADPPVAVAMRSTVFGRTRSICIQPSAEALLASVESDAASASPREFEPRSKP